MSSPAPEHSRDGNAADPAWRPVLGVAADDPLVRQRVRQALGRRFHLRPVCGLDELEPAAEVAAWLVFLPEDALEQASIQQAVEGLTRSSRAPVWLTDEVIPNVGTAAHRRWTRRLMGKLACAREAGPAAPAAPFPPQVWVLGASLGGPTAVKAFLDRLDPAAPPAFIYAQHGDGKTLDVLSRVLGRHSRLRVRLAAP